MDVMEKTIFSFKGFPLVEELFRIPESTLTSQLKLANSPICNSEAKISQLSAAKDAYACLMLSQEEAILTLRTKYYNYAAAYSLEDECSGMPALGAMRVRILGKSSPNLTFLEAVLTFIEACFPYHSCSANFMALHSCMQSLL